jgi:hypothetical protein
MRSADQAETDQSATQYTSSGLFKKYVLLN